MSGEEKILAAIGQLDKRIGVMQEDINELKTNQISMQNDINELKTNQISMQNDINELKTNQISMQNDINELKTNQISMQNDINELKTNQISMQEDMDKRFKAVDERFNTMQEDMDKRFEEMEDSICRRILDIQYDLYEFIDKKIQEINKRLDEAVLSAANYAISTNATIAEIKEKIGMI